MDSRLARTATRNVARRAFSLVSLAVLMLAACQHQTTQPEAIAPVSNRMPRNPARFLIDSASDTTVVFRGSEAHWLRVGMRANVVDPAQRDALIARVTIMSVDTARVVATITGKVSQVSASHAVLIALPEKSWWRDHRFWFGAIVGAIAGAFAGSASH
ncbi:MAG: hypothetical protein ABJB66_13780 [Gemmatimonadaceae bacterium]